MKSVIVIVGPSGVGKDTVASKIFEKYPDMSYSVSVTTRAPRPNEVEGKDYQFLSLEDFNKLLEKDGMVEYCMVHGNYYGTLKGDIEGILAKGNRPLLIVDVHGYDQIRAAYPLLTKGIFIYPPSMTTLEDRLRGRNSDSEEVILNRLKAAEDEIKTSKSQDYSLRVINDGLELCLKEVFEFIDNIKS